MLWARERKHFVSTEGADAAQTRIYGGAGIKIVAAEHGEVAVRSWPMDLDGGVLGCGYEAVAKLALDANAPRIRAEAIALLTAPPCPAGPTTLVLDTPQLALQIHESCGHPTEADRALGEEISLAGASFLTPDKLGKFKYGTPRVNLTADATSPGGLGTFGWDDEGVAAHRTPLVARGIFVGYLSSRDVAGRLGLGRSAGCLRAQSWNRPPIIRMINVSLEADPTGPASLDELVADTQDGVLMTTNRSWSIDDLRLNFQFGCEAAWKIERGRKTTLYKKPLYTGITPKFWGGCDAIGRPDAWKLWGFVSCGKGDPMQLMSVGHGCAPARFRDVEVGTSA
jgi:TldD protein